MTIVDTSKSSRAMMAVPSVMQFVSGALTAMFVTTSFSMAQEPSAKELHQRASARIVSYREHLRKTGDKASKADDLMKAVRELNQAYRGFVSAGDDSEAAACRVEGGDALRHRDQFEEALKLYAEGESLARKANAHGTLARALIGQGITRLFGTKDNEGAEANANEAIRVSLRAGDQKLHFEALCLKCEVDLVRGKLVSALDWIDQAMRLDPPVEDERLLFFAFYDRSNVYAAFVDLWMARPAIPRFILAYADEAVRDAKRTLAIAQKLDWMLVAQQADRLVRARTRKRELLDLRLPAIELNAFHPVKHGDVRVTQEYVSAEGIQLPPELTQWIRDRKAAFPDDLASISAQAQMDALSGNGDQALAGYQRALELLEGDYRPLRDIEARGILIGLKLDLYYWPMLYLLKRDKVSEAFQLLEASRSRTLTDLVLTREKVAFADPSERELYAQLRDLRPKIAGQKVVYERSVRAMSVKPNESKDANESNERMLHQIEVLENEHRDLLQKIRTKAPRLLQLVTADTVPLAAVQQSAATSGYDVLEYAVLESQVIIWHIGKSGVHVGSVFLPHDQLRRKVDGLRNTLSNPRVTLDTMASRELFLFLVDSMLHHVTTDHLVAVPHEELYSVPFQVLQDPADGRYVGERFRVSYAPSAGVLQRLHDIGSLAGSTVLAIADPEQPFMEKEAKTIAGLYPGSKVLALKDRQDKRGIKSHLEQFSGGYHVLHLAAHAQFNDNEPMLSRILLSTPDPKDGKFSADVTLTAAEMFALPLGQTRLVTLSACETGRVAETTVAAGVHAGEMLGMPRAILCAGAQAVMLTQWQVDSEATHDWMQRFYLKARDVSLAEAARQATIYLKAQPRYAHPYYWGAYYLVGR
jgi:CHAT domain-containing protein